MSILRNINYMKRFVAHPCQTPNPIVLIEFAFEAGLPVLFELLSADIMDKALAQAKQIGRATKAVRDPNPLSPGGKAGPSTGHGRRAGGQFGRRANGKKVGPAEWMFEVTDAEQTGMYWWLVADMATEFMARWTTLIYLKQGCPFEHECFATGPFNGIYIGKGSSPQILPILSTGVVASGGHTIQQFRNGKFSITYTARLVKFLSNDPPSAARLELVGGVGAGKVWQTGAGGQADPAGGVLAGGFWNFEHDRDNPVFPGYEIHLVNDSDTETVGCVDGILTLSSGFCNNAAPSVPWDSNHLVPFPHGKASVGNRIV